MKFALNLKRIPALTLIAAMVCIPLLATVSDAKLRLKEGTNYSVKKKCLAISNSGRTLYLGKGDVLTYLSSFNQDHHFMIIRAKKQDPKEAKLKQLGNQFNSQMAQLGGSSIDTDVSTSVGIELTLSEKVIKKNIKKNKRIKLSKSEKNIVNQKIESFKALIATANYGPEKEYHSNKVVVKLVDGRELAEKNVLGTIENMVTSLKKQTNVSDAISIVRYQKRVAKLLQIDSPKNPNIMEQTNINAQHLLLFNMNIPALYNLFHNRDRNEVYIYVKNDNGKEQDFSKLFQKLKDNDMFTIEIRKNVSPIKLPPADKIVSENDELVLKE
jgi:hypothetical protein